MSTSFARGTGPRNSRAFLEEALPPGPTTLIAYIPHIAGPLAIVYLGIVLVEQFTHRSTPVWATVLACLLSCPTVYGLYSVWIDFHMSRRAAQLGARVPIVAHTSRIPDMPADSSTAYFRDTIFRQVAKFGPYYIYRPFNLFRLFFTVEPEHIKAILSTNFTNFEKGETFRRQVKSLLGVGVFNSDDELWKFHRSMTRPFFSKDRITHFDIFDRHALDAIQQMKSRVKEGYAVDWQDLASRFTLDSASEFLFGKDVCSLSTGIPYPPTSDIGRITVARPDADAFAFAFKAAQEVCADRQDFMDLWGIREFFKDKVKAQRSAIDRLVDPIIAEALRRKDAQVSIGEKPSDEDTLLSHLVKATDDANLIRDEILNILLAGRDTTACTLTFAVYSLAENPDVMQRLRQEILNVVGPTRRPTYDNIRNMKFLRAVINETLRLYPPVPVNLRTAIKDIVLPAVNTGEPGIFVPAGMRCVYSVFNMHRRKDLWGPDALSFDPDRFLDERLHKYLTPNPFIFLPFNAGPRICLGQQFAYNETSFMLVRLLQQVSSIQFTPEVAPESMIPPNYNDSPGSDGKDRVWISRHLTAFAKGGLWIKVTDAADE